ncbi:MAG: hypothetical protein Q8K85_09355 [Hyphomicrobium sp.]|nr:hypothetical protein [Hyphomicrobium sp.]
MPMIATGSPVVNCARRTAGAGWISLRSGPRGKAAGFTTSCRTSMSFDAFGCVVRGFDVSVFA